MKRIYGTCGTCVACVSLISIMFVSVFITMFIALNNALAAQLYVGDIKNEGNIAEVPIMVDNVENLAGVKLSIEYKTEFLTFKNAGKTTYSSNLLHVVNNKTPGEVILVMAGAEGIKGKDFPLVNLIFEVKGSKVEKTWIKITCMELVGDNLQPITCKIRD